MDKMIEEGFLRQILITEFTCDVVLSCFDRKLMAHKLILSIASPLLRELLLEKPDNSSSAMLIFPDISGKIMAMILDYIYTGTVIICGKALEEFLAITKFLKISVDLSSAAAAEEEEEQKRKIPDLLPINKKKTICNVIVPSPWCRRDERSYLNHPHENIPVKKTLILPEDPNNNNNQRAKVPTKCLNKIIEQLHDANNKDKERFLLKTGATTNFPFSQQLIGLATSNNNNNESKLISEPTTTSSNKSVIIINEQQVKIQKACKNLKKKSYKCLECGKCFSQVRNYKYHKSLHEGTKEFAAKCSECGKIFNDRGYLSSHMKIHRDRKEYACPHCPKRFNQRVAFNMHIRIHTGVKPHECTICGKSFSRKMLLKQHQRVHTGERPYSCPECGKSFADRSNMSLHVRLHTGMKPYACSMCPKRFTKKHHLKTHMNFHNGLKPYSCENCGLAFSQSSNMRTHFKKCILKKNSEHLTDH